MEANYARYLNKLKIEKEIKEWFFEPDRFYLEKLNRVYIPDFKIINNDLSIEYHEVKGRLIESDKVKMDEFVKTTVLKEIDKSL